MTYVYSPSKSPPAGWVVFNGQLEPDGTVAGYMARGREVRGSCHQRDCRRRCHMDFERLAARGLGGARVQELTRLFRCNRLDGCALEFHEERGVEITLSLLVGGDYVALRIACQACRKATLARPEAVIERLKKEGTGGGDTPVEKLPGLIRGPCPKCNARCWRADVLWHDPANVPAWIKRALEQG